MVIDAMQGQDVRLLILVPIIHTQADLGSLQESVRRSHIERTRARAMGPAAGGRDGPVADHPVADRAINLDYGRVRLYQDGLPAAARRMRSFVTWPAQDSVNHQILVDLMAKGAKLTGTEAPELLVKEYELAREALALAEVVPDGQTADLKYARLEQAAS